MRTLFSRLLLVALVVVAAVAIGRVALGIGGGGGGAIDLGRLRPDALAHDAFRIAEPSRVAINAAGSFEEPGPGADTTLAAYGWIVRRADGALVWRMRPARPARGTFVAVRDTIALDPGDYDVYFASHGDPLVRTVDDGDGSLGARLRAALSRGGRSWHGDAGRWRFEVDPVSGRLDRILGESEDPARATSEADVPGRLWSSGAVRNHQTRETLLQVTAPTTVRVRATFEAYEGVVADSAYLVRLSDRDTVWTARPEGARWAGGSTKNQMTRADVTLAPGLYRAVYHADRTHGYGDWSANPPFAPWHWGMEIEADEGAAVAPVDPSRLDLPVIAEIRCVGPDETREETFTLPAPADILLLAVGEVIGSSAYDYASLDRTPESGEAERVWTMETSETEPAGGADKNRRVLAPLSLGAGTYTLRYQTDGSHDCEEFNSGRPERPDLWGAVLYATDPSFDPSTIVRPASPSAPEADEHGTSAGEAADAPQTLVRLDRVGNDEERAEAFTLSEPALVRVVAMGELLPSERLDWGWIEDDDGDRVWEMTRDNTGPAGGPAKNRRHTGTLQLDAGTYTVHYRSNGRHAYGDFDGRPVDPDEWGIRVDRLAAAPEAAPEE